MIKPEQRKLLHCNVAKYYEVLYYSDLGQVASFLAHHWKRAENHEKATHFQKLSNEQIAGAYTGHQQMVKLAGKNRKNAELHKLDSFHKKQLQLDVNMPLTIVNLIGGRGAGLTPVRSSTLGSIVPNANVAVGELKNREVEEIKIRIEELHSKVAKAGHGHIGHAQGCFGASSSFSLAWEQVVQEYRVQFGQNIKSKRWREDNICGAYEELASLYIEIDDPNAYHMALVATNRCEEYGPSRSLALCYGHMLSSPEVLRSHDRVLHYALHARTLLMKILSGTHSASGFSMAEEENTSRRLTAQKGGDLSGLMLKVAMQYLNLAHFEQARNLLEFASTMFQRSKSWALWVQAKHRLVELCIYEGRYTEALELNAEVGTKLQDHSSHWLKIASLSFWVCYYDVLCNIHLGKTVEAKELLTTTMQALIDSVRENADKSAAEEWTDESSFYDVADRAATLSFLQVMMVKHFSLLSIVQLRLGDANRAAKVVDKLGRMWSDHSSSTIEISPFCDDCVAESLLEMLIYVVNHGTSGEMLLKMSELKLRGMAMEVVKM